MEFFEVLFIVIVIFMIAILVFNAMCDFEERRINKEIKDYMRKNLKIPKMTCRKKFFICVEKVL